MATLIGEWMVQKNKHLPKELYREIISYLLPKHLQGTKEIKIFNKVVHSIPGFHINPSKLKIVYTSATKKFRIVKFIYWLENLEIPNNISQYKSIVIYSPYIEHSSEKLREEYHIYHLIQGTHGGRRVRQDKLNKLFIERAKYGQIQETKKLKEFPDLK